MRELTARERRNVAMHYNNYIGDLRHTQAALIALADQICTVWPGMDAKTRGSVSTEWALLMEELDKENSNNVRFMPLVMALGNYRGKEAQMANRISAAYNKLRLDAAGLSRVQILFPVAGRIPVLQSVDLPCAEGDKITIVRGDEDANEESAEEDGEEEEEEDDDVTDDEEDDAPPLKRHRAE